MFISWQDYKVRKLVPEIYKKHHILFSHVSRKGEKYVRARCGHGKVRKTKAENDPHSYMLRIGVSKPTKAEAYKAIKNIINNIIENKVDMWIVGFVPRT